MGKIKGLITDTNRKWWTLVIVSFALFMIVLDSSVVNLAIPKIMKDFGATITQIEWISNAYLLTFAIFLITFGRLGDMIGRKRMFAFGIVAFVAGSILSGLAGNATQLIVFRIIQGLGGASMMPATLSLISANFEKKERGTAMGIWGAVSGLGIVAGPIIGGFITDRGLGHAINQFLGISEYWRYVFYINLPFGLLALLLTIVAIRESRDAGRKHNIDFAGILLSMISVFLLTFAFIEGHKYGWWQANTIPEAFGYKLHFGSISIIPVLFALSTISGLVFVLYERATKKEPMMDVNLFSNRNFSAGNFSVAVLSFALMGASFLLPLFLQSVLGYSAFKSGLVMLPLAGAIMFVAPIGGKLTDKLGGKWVIITGLLVMSLGIYLIGHFTLKTAFSNLVLPTILLGTGMGLANGPLSTVTLLDIPPAEFGGASGVTGTVRQVGAVMGIAILGALLQSNMSTSIATNIDGVKGLPQPVKTQIVGMTKDNGAGMLSNSKSKDKIKLTMQDAMKKEMITKMKSVKPPVIPANLSPEAKAQIQMQIQAKMKRQIEAQKLAMAKESKTMGDGISTAVKQSFTDSINNTMRYASLIALFSALTALLLKNTKGGKEEVAQDARVVYEVG